MSILPTPCHRFAAYALLQRIPREVFDNSCTSCSGGNPLLHHARLTSAEDLWRPEFRLSLAVSVAATGIQCTSNVLID